MDDQKNSTNKIIEMLTNCFHGDLELCEIFMETAKKYLEGELRLSDILKISDAELEKLYTIGYNFYQTGRYKEAMNFFKCLTLFDHLKPKYWMALGSVQQVLEKYSEALKAYDVSATLDNLKNPKPVLYSAECYISLGEHEKARRVLKLILKNKDNDYTSEQDREIIVKAAALDSTLSDMNIKNSTSSNVC